MELPDKMSCRKAIIEVPNCFCSHNQIQIDLDISIHTYIMDISRNNPIIKYDCRSPLAKYDYK